MLKILLGVGLGFLLFTNQDARQFGNYRNYQTQHGRTSAYRTAETKARQTGKVYRIVDGDGNLVDLFYP